MRTWPHSLLPTSFCPCFGAPWPWVSSHPEVPHNLSTYYTFLQQNESTDRHPGAQSHTRTPPHPQPSGLSPVVVIGSRRDSHQCRSWKLDRRLGGLGGWNHRHPVQRPTSDLYSSCAKRTQSIIKSKRILLPPAPALLSLRNAWLTFPECKTVS